MMAKMMSSKNRTISPPSMLMEVMITYILYFILDSFYFHTELLDYFLNIIILSNFHSFIPDDCSYRSVIFNYEISRLRFAPLEIRGLSVLHLCEALVFPCFDLAEKSRLLRYLFR